MRNHIMIALLLVGAMLAMPLAATPAAAQPGNTLILQVDRPTASDQLTTTSSFGGWAIDTSVLTSPGISQVAVYMDGDATTGRYLGQAQLGGNRPDVAVQFGNGNYAYSGWNFSLANLGITGQHSFTFVAIGAQGPVTTKTVGLVTLVAPPPTYSYRPQPPVSTAYNYTQPTSYGYGYGYTQPSTYSYGYTQSWPYNYGDSYNYGQPWLANYLQPTTSGYWSTPPATYSYGYTQPWLYSYTRPWVYNYLQPTTYSYNYTQPWTSTSGSDNQPLIYASGSTQPGVYGYNYGQSRVVAPVGLSISVPASGSRVGTSFQLTGVTSAVPYNGTLSYTLTNPNGVVVASGNLTVTGNAGQTGSFTGWISYVPGAYGYGTLTVVETDGGTTVGSTTLSLFLAN